MLEINSQRRRVEMSREELFKHFSDFKNMAAIMPENVERFEADEDSFLFGMKGLPDVRLRLEGKEEPEFMRFRSASDKLNFQLQVLLHKVDDACEVEYKFAGEFNAMMRMMVEKPLRNFIEALAENTARLSA